MLDKFMFFFWIIMIFFAAFMGFINFVTGNMLVFGINAVTVVLASFNARWVFKSIKQ